MGRAEREGTAPGHRPANPSSTTTFASMMDENHRDGLVSPHGVRAPPNSDKSGCENPLSNQRPPYRAAVAALISSRNERASSEAPPIRPPSMSFCASSSGALAGFIEPP